MIFSRRYLLIISTLGIAVSLYLTYFKLTGSTIKCAYGSCDIVQNSKYSQIAGIPVASLGVLFYLALFFLVFYKRRALTILWTGFGLIFSAYLTYLEIFVIREICQWCVLSALLVLISFFLSVLSYKK